MCGCLLRALHWGPACNPGMCPDWELNQRLQAGTQSTEPHQLEQYVNIFKRNDLGSEHACLVDH